MASLPDLSGLGLGPTPPRQGARLGTSVRLKMLRNMRQSLDKHISNIERVACAARAPRTGASTGVGDEVYNAWRRDAEPESDQEWLRRYLDPEDPIHGPDQWFDTRLKLYRAAAADFGKHYEQLLFAVAMLTLLHHLVVVSWALLDDMLPALGGFGRLRLIELMDMYDTLFNMLRVMYRLARATMPRLPPPPQPTLLQQDPVALQRLLDELQGRVDNPPAAPQLALPAPAEEPPEQDAPADQEL